jgi:uncharacterized membrane protein
MEFGGKFWLSLIGIAVAGMVAVMIVFFIIGWAWYSFGFLGAFLLLALVALFLGWWHDRREARLREEPLG